MNHDDFIAELTRSLRGLEQAAVALMPRLVAAVLVLFVTLLGAWVLRALVRRALRGLANNLPGSDERERWREKGAAAANAAGGGVFWLTLLVGMMLASEALGLRVLQSWLSAVAGYLPNVLLAIAIGFAGILGGQLAGGAIRRASGRVAPHQAHQLGRLTQLALALVALLVAASQLGLDVSLLTAVFLIWLASLLGGAALAFGLGARSVMGNILAMHYVNKAYGIGQLVRVGDHQGRIVRTSATSVFLEHEEGEIAIPGHEFAEQRCIRLVASHGA